MKKSLPTIGHAVRCFVIDSASRCRKLLCSWGAAVSSLCVAYLATIAVAGLNASPARGDLAVVLGNAVSPDGLPSLRLQARLDTALDLFRTGAVRRVMVSGGIEPSGSNEAAIMAAYLVRRGMPAAAILEDPHGDDTFATARNTARLFSHGSGVVVVTQWFHVPRTMLAMRRFGFRNVSAAWPRYLEWRDAYSLLREAIALPTYAFRRVAPGEKAT